MKEELLIYIFAMAVAVLLAWAACDKLRELDELRYRIAVLEATVNGGGNAHEQP